MANFSQWITLLPPKLNCFHLVVFHNLFALILPGNTYADREEGFVVFYPMALLLTS